eukprot:scaffold67914_cov48-Phaeocystis_antarctica.AAC.1
MRRFAQPGHPWGLRTGPIREGSQPGPRLDRKARAGKDPKAHVGFKANQACSVIEIVSSSWEYGWCNLG